ncbi:MAG: glycosyltransferase family 2 protein [Acidobacteriota bacterium]
MPVAVLIVNFRVYDELDRALASLEPALRDGDEVVVFDQVSDATRVAELGQRHPRTRWMVSEENLGFAAAVNRAAGQTTAPYLLWLNPDSAVGPGLIDALERWLDAHPSVGCAGPRVINEDGSVQASARRFPDLSTAIAGRSTWLTRHFPNNPLSRHNLLARDRDQPSTVDWLAGSCVMTRRSLFERLGGFDEGFFLYWEDADYCRRALALGFTCAYLPHAMVRHAGGRSAARDPGPAIRAFHASAYRMFAKHASGAGRLIVPFAWLALTLRGAVLSRVATRRARQTDGASTQAD